MILVTKSILITALLVCILISCKSKNPKLYMKAYRSEGMTTTTIEFADDGSYIIKEATFIGSDDIKGKYTIQHSFITLNKIGKDGFIKSKLLFLKTEEHDGLIMYQLNPNKQIDTILYKFYCNLI